MIAAGMMLVGVLLDVAVGWPDGLYRRIGHPVTWLGALIGWCDRGWNHGGRGRRLTMGAVTVGVVIAAAALPMMLVGWALGQGWAAVLIGGVLAWPWLALRSMHDHVAAVAKPLERGDQSDARQAVSMIVGRDVTRLDEAGVARAALESLAENTSDGIVAPLFWGVIGGLPGIAAYKAINTMDSMIGHRSERHEAFGKAAARLDDVVNWIPARITGLLFALSQPGRIAQAFRVMREDAGKHRSPNAGWPEGALAGALAIRLSGPRVYATGTVEEPWLNGGAPDPTPADLSKGLRLYRRAMVGAALLLALIWWI